MKRVLSAILVWLLSTLAAGAVPQVAAQATASAATLTATATGVTNLTWWIYGFEASCGEATAALSVQGSLTGLIGGDIKFVVSSGALVGGPVVSVIFPTPIPTTAPATNVVLSWATLGTGSICAGTIFGELR